MKALLSIHRLYALPLVAGRTRGPPLILGATGLLADIGSDLLFANRKTYVEQLSSRGSSNPRTLAFVVGAHASP
jgi:hypothetical protein